MGQNFCPNLLIILIKKKRIAQLLTENWAKTDTTTSQTTPKAPINKTTNKRSQPTTTTN
jgi:hypothetical protein